MLAWRQCALRLRQMVVCVGHWMRAHATAPPAGPGAHPLQRPRAAPGGGAFGGDSVARGCWHRPSVAAAAAPPGGASSSGGDGSGGGNPKRQRGRRPKQPGMFEVRVITPPPRSLGVYELPPLTHNGEELVIDGEGYVVQRLVLHYKLRGGKYQRDHNALEVTPTGRYFTELMLNNLMTARYVGPTGPQD
ncbi:MAG: hypothetical protein J3K34DRAFT_481681 [Monoraphidium minutum]|nr:MAG: hypothetical protein J3K34DRAFT_481681 [Monoraphidium minutum]